MSNPPTIEKRELSVDISEVLLSEVPADTNTIGLAREAKSILEEPEVIIVTDLAILLLEKMKVPAYNLTTEQQAWIQEFIKASPKSFETIANDIKTITKDGKIDVHDIPATVKLFADVYHSAAAQSGLVDAKNVIAFIKFTLNVILESRLLVLPEMEKKVIDTLIDTSLSLLLMNIDSRKTGERKWYDFFVCR